MIIQKAENTDSRGTAIVHVNAWQIAYKNIIPDDTLQSLSIEKSAKFWSEKIISGSVETMVCKENAEIRGFINFGKPQFDDNFNRNTIEIWGLYIDPLHFRRGFGLSLLKEAEKKIFNEVYDRIILHCFKENSNSRSFYEAMKYVLTGKNIPHPRFNHKQLIEYEKRRQKR
jgi:ribosomal protein S18 acetylase RimI-like enzyme